MLGFRNDTYREKLCFTQFSTAYYETKNPGTRNTGETVEHVETGAEERSTLEYQWNTPEYQRNTNVAPVEQPRTT